MSDKFSKTITILIADDEQMARAGIRTLLAQADDFEIIGEAKVIASTHPIPRRLDSIYTNIIFSRWDF